MIPLEVVMRGVAAGSFVKRNPGLQRGTLLVPRVVEFFLKDDAQPRSADRARSDRRAQHRRPRRKSAR